MHFLHAYWKQLFIEVQNISNNLCGEVPNIFNVLYMFFESRAFFKIITQTRKKASELLSYS